MNTHEAVVEVENLSKRYGVGPGAVEAIHDVSLTTAMNEFVTVVGPSGAGKTTLLRCIAGLLPASGGRIAIHGDVVTGPPRDLAFVFQDYSRSLMHWFSVAKNVELPLCNKVRNRSARRAKVAEALRAVGLEDVAGRYPWQLSGGMQQRVALARALAYGPELLLMDEPFASVDAQTRADLEDLLLKVHASTQASILFVTHDIDEAVYLGDRVIVVSARPTVVRACITVGLPRPREQIATKSDPRYSELRAEVMQLIRRDNGSAEDERAAGAAGSQRD